MIILFSKFRQDVKILLHDNNMTYSQISEKTGIAESTIKCFMCGASDSRRIAECISDVLDCELVYSNGSYMIKDKKEEKRREMMFRIKELRLQKGITQEQLAQHLNVAKSTIGMWENEKREPNFKMLIRIADYFDCSIDYLLGRTNDPMTK